MVGARSMLGHLPTCCHALIAAPGVEATSEPAQLHGQSSRQDPLQAHQQLLLVGLSDEQDVLEAHALRC